MFNTKTHSQGLLTGIVMKKLHGICPARYDVLHFL